MRYAAEIQELRRAARARDQELAAATEALTRARAQQLTILGDLKQAIETERQHRVEAERARLSTIQTIVLAIEARDGHTGGHSERVRQYCLTLGRRMELAPAALEELEVAAILHDLGNIAVPDSVLTKTERLTGEERRVLDQHPVVGARIVRALPFAAGAIPGILTHHEHWDGSGYPQGLAGAAIAISGRIIAVADAFDAMTTTRVFRSGLGLGAAVDELQRCAGTHFDPQVVTVFVDAWKGREIP